MALRAISVLCGLVLCWGAAGVVLAQGEAFPGVQQLMTPEEYAKAGLDKLTTEEKAALDAWLLRYTAQEAPVLQRHNEAVQEQADETIHSSIVGAFSGWGGSTQFTLANGQVWQQRHSGSWRTQAVQNPAVTIEKNLLGFYELHIDGMSRSVGVKRIR